MSGKRVLAPTSAASGANLSILRATQPGLETHRRQEMSQGRAAARARPHDQADYDREYPSLCLLVGVQRRGWTLDALKSAI